MATIYDDPESIPLYAQDPFEAGRAQGASFGQLPAPPPFRPELPEVYDPDRPSTWDAEDAPIDKFTTLDRQNKKQAELVAQQEKDAQLAEAGMAGMQDWGSMAPALGGNPGDPSYALGAAGLQRADQLESQAWDTAQSVADAPSTVVKSPNALHGPAMEYVAKSREANQGILQATEDAGSASYGAQLARMSIMARQEAEVAALTEAREKAEARREQRLIDQHQASLAAQEEVTKAADAFRSAPEEDPGRYWASKSAFQKVALAISAVAKGWLMGQGFNVDPMGTIKAGIREDIDAQRSNRALLGERLTARERQARGAFEVYDQLRGQIVDESTRDEVIFNGRMRAVEAELAKAQAEAQVNMTSAEVDGLLAQAQKEIAESDFRLAAVAAANPQFFTKVVKAKNVSVAGPDGKMRTVPVTFATKAAEKGLDRAADMRRQGFDISATGAQAEGKETAEVAAETRKELASRKGAMEPAEKRAKFQQRAYLAEPRVVALREEIRQIEDFKKKYEDDVPGYGTLGWLGTMNLTDKQQGAREQLMRIVMLRLRPESGAAISSEELQRESQGTIEGMDPDKVAAIREARTFLEDKDEADILRMLGDREVEARHRLDDIERVVDPEDLEEFYRSTPGRKASKATQTVDVDDPVNWDAQ